jgi:hypothetical protein
VRTNSQFKALQIRIIRIASLIIQKVLDATIVDNLDSFKFDSSGCRVVLELFCCRVGGGTNNFVFSERVKVRVAVGFHRDEVRAALRHHVDRLARIRSVKVGEAVKIFSGGVFFGAIVLFKSDGVDHRNGDRV